MLKRLTRCMPPAKRVLGIGLLASAGCGSLSCSGPEQPEGAAESDRWNVLVFLLDDLGCDQFGVYDDINQWPKSYLENTGSESAPGYAPTPFLEELAREGLRFTRFHAQPSCSPTRASLLTGNYPHVHGIGNPIGEWRDPLAEDEPDLVKLEGSFKTIPEVLRETPSTREVVSQCIGKWHLSGRPYEAGRLAHPVREGGFDRYIGCMTNLDRFQSTSYTDWLEVEVARVDGEVEVHGPSRTSRHRLEHQVEETISFLHSVAEGDRFFGLVAFHTAHSPFDVFDPESPPFDGSGRASQQPWGDRWHPYTLDYLDPDDGPPAANRASLLVRRLRSMTSSCDSAMRMIVDALAPEVRAKTVILVVGDNGTINPLFRDEYADPPKGAYPSGHGKRTVYELGILAPLIVHGPVVPSHRAGDVEDGLVDSVDLYGLILDNFGAAWEADGLDAISPMELITGGEGERREFSFSEEFHPNGAPLGPVGSYKECVRSVQRIDGWKLIHSFADGVEREALYHLPTDPKELNDRMIEAEEIGVARDAYHDLSTALQREFL